MKYAIKLFIIVYISLSHINNICCQNEEDLWLEPDAWTLDQLNDGCKCSSDFTDKSHINTIPDKVSTDEVALVYYRKLISLLFDRKDLKFDDSLQRYERSVTFSLQTSQLEKLERLKDPRDLDNVIMEIFENSRNVPNTYGHCHTSNNAATGFELIADIFRDTLQLIQTSEIRFLLIVMVVALSGWILNKRYRIGLLALLGGGLFAFGYLHTYLECNRELEVNEMIEILDRNKEPMNQEMQSGFFGYLKGLFSKSKNIEERELLKKSTKISLGFCRPDHVLIRYFNDIFLKYLEVLLEQCTKTLTSLQANLSFPSYIIASFFLISIIGFVIKLTFQHILSPAVWSNVMRSKSDSHHHNQGAPLTQGSGNSSGDHISGENLKLLLNAINVAPLRQQLQMNVVSGVEEVRECIEAPPSNSDDGCDIKSSSKCKDNNNTQNNKVDKSVSNVILEDAPEDI
ncbi:uncharacterized protein [Musca autumnalis]|uniref:uncharacterized protein n=1 Tax=Musca autumnalis TaxID=221902 RepID=UPI003CFB9210